MNVIVQHRIRLAPHRMIGRRPISPGLRRAVLVMFIALGLLLSTLMVHSAGSESPGPAATLSTATVDGDRAAAADRFPEQVGACATVCDPMVAIAMVCWVFAIVVLAVFLLQPRLFGLARPIAAAMRARVPANAVRRRAPSLHALSVCLQ